MRRLLALLLVVVAALAAAAPAGALTSEEANRFLDPRGLEAHEFGVRLESTATLEGYAGEGTLGTAEPGVIRVVRNLHPRIHALVLLHEVGHQISYPWTCSPSCDDWTQAEADLYEEGPVHAWALDNEAAWWRYLTGKRLDRMDRFLAYISVGYVPLEVATWRFASAMATGEPAQSRAARDWRAWVLTVPVGERPALLEELGLA